jgi:hypothetical protein
MHGTYIYVYQEGANEVFVFTSMNDLEFYLVRRLDISLFFSLNWRGDVLPKI